MIGLRKVLVLFFLVVLFAACEKKEIYQTLRGGIYGTTYTISYQSKNNYTKGIRAAMNEVNHSLSMFDSTSVISRINQQDSVKADSLFINLFHKAKEIHKNTGGVFDITVAPLVNAWGFGYKEKRIPTPKQVDSLLSLVGLDKVDLEDGHVIKRHPKIEMDASAIAKGYGVDRVAMYLDRMGVENYMVEIGGEVRVSGVSDKNRPWRIGIDRPIENLANRQLEFIVEMKTGALATSGNYRNFYIIDGKKYAHTINPLTGYPIQTRILSSTVFAPTCMEADAYATAFMVLGLEKSEVLAKQLGLEVCFIYDDNGELKSWMTPHFKEMLLE